MKCPICYNDLEKTEWRPEGGYDPRLREYTCGCRRVYSYLITRPSEIKKEAEGKEQAH